MRALFWFFLCLDAIEKTPFLPRWWHFLHPLYMCYCYPLNMLAFPPRYVQQCRVKSSGIFHLFPARFSIDIRFSVEYREIPFQSFAVKFYRQFSFNLHSINFKLERIRWWNSDTVYKHIWICTQWSMDYRHNGNEWNMLKISVPNKTKSSWLECKEIEILIESHS